MNKNFDPRKALKKLKENPDRLVCDALLDQNIFAGVGNIIKNEVLFRIRVHPENTIEKLPLSKRKLLITEAVKYSFDFLRWKKRSELKKHWLVHTKMRCPRDGKPIKKAYWANQPGVRNYIKKGSGMTFFRRLFYMSCRRNSSTYG